MNNFYLSIFRYNPYCLRSKAVFEDLFFILGKNLFTYSFLSVLAVPGYVVEVTTASTGSVCKYVRSCESRM